MKIIDIEVLETAEQIAQHIDNAMKQGYDRFETKHRRKDGKIIDIEVSSQFCDFEQEKFFFSCFRDITKRKKAEEALQLERSKLATILGSMEDGVYIVDQNENIQYVNSVLKKEFGEPEGRKCYDYFHDRKEVCPWCKNKDVFAGKTVRWEWYSFKNQQTYDLIETPLRNPDGSISKLKIFRDITERKKGEEALRESENKYRTLVENIPQKIFFKDKNSVYVSCNDNLARDLKIKSEEIAGKTDYDLVPKELAEKYRADDKRIIETGQTEDIEESYIQDGREVIIHTVKKPVKDEQGNVIRVLGIFRDITERKQAEEALRQSEEQYRSVVENIGIGVCIISPKMEILAMNRQLRELFPDIDVSKKPICYKSFNKPSRDDICSYCPTYKSLKDGQVHESITETPAGDEIENWRIISSPIKDKDGKVIAAIEMTEEITEQKKAEDALRKSKERYKALFESATEGIVIVDIETKEFKYANPALCRMLGYTEKEIKGMRVHDFHPEESLEYVLSEFEAQARGEKILSPGIPCLRKDGTIMYADIKTGKIIMDRRECNLGFFTDITEHKRIKADLENYKDKILKAQKHAYIGSMGAIVANEFTLISME